MRVFLDTNVLVSAFATRGLSADVQHLVLAEHELVLGEAVLDELARVLREKLEVPEDIVRSTERFLRAEAEIVGHAPALGIELPDPDDIFIVEQAVEGRAEVLVTGDRALLTAAAQLDLPVQVTTPRGFWERVRNR